MARKKVDYRKRKNRGGERLNEWRVLNKYGLVDSGSNKRMKMDIITQESDSFGDNCEYSELEVEAVAPGASTSTNSAIDMNGRRIVDIKYFIRELTNLNEHAPNFGCNLSNLEIISEAKRGLMSGFVFLCNMCNFKKTIWSEPVSESEVMDVNTAAVAGAMTAGGGFTALQRILGAMDIRCMNARTYERHHEKVSKGWEETALREMKEAAEEEIRLANQRGDVSKDGTPLLTVVADGSWAKRSYRKNFNSLSGMAAIVGYHTRKVLYFGVKNKYCTTCARNQSNDAKKPHTCFKNWSGSSSSMESAVIVEGFLASEEMYGVRYERMIADGDSSVYNSILEARPYENLTVVKVECRNHMLRNYCNKLKELATTSVRVGDPGFDRALHLKMRRIIGARVMKLRAAVTKAIRHRKCEQGTMREKSEKLRLDILNGPSHVFGEHLHCKLRGYFCNGPTEGEQNHIPDMRRSGLLYKVMEAVNVLADHSSHLILDVDSNMVEHYNAVIARFTSGKRINFCQKGSYQARCAAAVVSHNTGKPIYKLHRTLYKKSPGLYSKLYENRASSKISNAATRNLVKPRVRRRLKMTPNRSEEKKHYGPLANKPDMDADLYKKKVDNHMVHLQKTEKEIIELELTTRGQSDSPVWNEERRIRLTASNFGLVCNRRPDSNCAPVVNKLLYTSLKTHSVQYGKEHEGDAAKQLEETLGIKVEPCGFFVDKEQPFLGASPDGLVGSDGIVEIKCPSSAETLTPEEVIENKIGLVGSMFTKTNRNTFSVKKTHPYYYQVQGQLHITGRAYCLLTIWTPKGIRVERIARDDDFWENHMQVKLKEFYLKCLLPEIVDPRKRRSLPIREPEHILLAQANKRKQKKNNK